MRKQYLNKIFNIFKNNALHGLRKIPYLCPNARDKFLPRNNTNYNSVRALRLKMF